jgi:hypothetical protein
MRDRLAPSPSPHLDAKDEAPQLHDDGYQQAIDQDPWEQVLLEE